METIDNAIFFGGENRALILEKAVESVEEAYMHPYLGGSVAFDVDVSDVACGCRAGVQLTTLDDGACTWDPYTNEVPRCSKLDLMEANALSFSSSSQTCSGRSCRKLNKCSASVEAGDIGPGSSFKIDTTLLYNVKVQFWADQDKDGTPTLLKNIHTVLSQGVNSVQLDQSCASLEDLSSDLSSLKFATSMSITHVEESCFTTPCTNPFSSLSNFVWTASDALYPYDEPVVKIEDGPADYLDSKGCGNDCSECRTFHMSNAPLIQFNECVDKVQYMYTQQCTNRSNLDKCMAAEKEYCFQSFLRKGRRRSLEKSCRTVPKSHRGTLDDTDTWMYHQREIHNANGLCKLGCTGTCHFSWPRREKKRIRTKIMARCKP